MSYKLLKEEIMMFVGTPGPMELIIIFVVILLLFGGKKLPELAKGLGKGIREFKKASKDIQDEFDVSELENDKNKSPDDNQ